jgi:hypothetical protein
MPWKPKGLAAMCTKSNFNHLQKCKRMNFIMKCPRFSYNKLKGQNEINTSKLSDSW